MSEKDLPVIQVPVPTGPAPVPASAPVVAPPVQLHVLQQQVKKRNYRKRLGSELDGQPIIPTPPAPPAPPGLGPSQELKEFMQQQQQQQQQQHHQARRAPQPSASKLQIQLELTRIQAQSDGMDRLNRQLEMQLNEEKERRRSLEVQVQNEQKALRDDNARIAATLEKMMAKLDHAHDAHVQTLEARNKDTKMTAAMLFELHNTALQTRIRKMTQHKMLPAPNGNAPTSDQALWQHMLVETHRDPKEGVKMLERNAGEAKEIEEEVAKARAVFTAQPELKTENPKLYAETQALIDATSTKLSDLQRLNGMITRALGDYNEQQKRKASAVAAGGVPAKVI